MKAVVVPYNELYKDMLKKVKQQKAISFYAEA
jgi:ribosomal protein L30/L7E